MDCAGTRVNEVEQDTEYVLRIGNHINRPAACETERCCGRDDWRHEPEHFFDRTRYFEWPPWRWRALLSSLAHQIGAHAGRALEKRIAAYQHPGALGAARILK